MTILPCIATILTLIWLAHNPNLPRALVALASFVFDLVVVGQYL